jgi:UDP-N-acetylmuramoylalanine--D-glutamate ligase
MFPKRKLKELSFLVYGLGLSGLSVIKFFKKNKITRFKVWDDKAKDIFNKHRTRDLKQSLKEVDFIVLSPGISLLKNKKILKFKKKIITDIDLFYLTNKNLKSIVVTGSNGKSTTSKLLAHLLKKNKIKFSLGGNIGTPILNLKHKGKSFVIIEASSFQLSHSKFIQPDYAFLLNLTTDHLDWHGNMKNYLNSKLKIFKLQSKKNYSLLNQKFKKIFKNKNFLGKLIIPNINDYKKIKIKIKNNYLTSSINNENMNFIYAFSKLLDIKDKSFIESMKSFKGLPHRFEIFFKRKNFTFINDSKATSFKATQLALSSLKNIYWILGGLPKKNDRINLSKYKKNINRCYIIGKNINFFKNQIKGKITFSITKNLKASIIKIIKDVKLENCSEKSILLSPSAASFDQFINFEERGEEFKRLCKQYARKFS